MAADGRVTDWMNLAVQRHWYRLRKELEHEIAAATDDLRRDYDISIQINSATVTSDAGRSVLRVPVSARWRDALEQTIAYVLVTSDEEDEPRIAAVAHGIEEALSRWIEREVPIGAAPVFLFPEAEVRWPEFDAGAGKTDTGAAAPAVSVTPAAVEAAPAPAATETAAEA